LGSCRKTSVNQQLVNAKRLGTGPAISNGIMLTPIQNIRQENIPQAAMPACTRQEAARLLETFRRDYQSLSLRARSQVKILMSALTSAQFTAELR
jgi:hypothetical protein